VWFLVPSLATSTTTFYIYYGNSGATTVSSIQELLLLGMTSPSNTVANYTTTGGTVTVDTTNKWMKLAGVSAANTVASPTTQTNPTSYIVEADVEIISQINGPAECSWRLLGFKSTLTGTDGYVAEYYINSGVKTVDIEKFTVAHLSPQTITASFSTFYPMKGTFVSGALVSLFK